MTDTVKPTGSNLFTALLAVQAEAPKLQKNAINPHFKNKYISLDALMDAIVPVLSKHKLIWATMPTTVNGEPALAYTLIHTPSGEQISEVMLLQAKAASPQDQGSAITYARRYSLMAVLGLVADEDDDGEKATVSAKAPANAVDKNNLLAMLKVLGRTPEDYEKFIGKTIDELTSTEIKEKLNELKYLVNRKNASPQTI